MAVCFSEMPYSSVVGCVYFFYLHCILRGEQGMPCLYRVMLQTVEEMSRGCLESNKIGVKAMHRERVAVIEAFCVVFFYLECIT